MKIPVKTYQEQEVENFNRIYNVGDKVVVRSDDGSEFEDQIRYPASVMGGHTAMAWLVKNGSYVAKRVLRKA